jgi:hypothetical protein
MGRAEPLMANKHQAQLTSQITNSTSTNPENLTLNPPINETIKNKNNFFLHPHQNSQRIALTTDKLIITHGKLFSSTHLGPS